MAKTTERTFELDLPPEAIMNAMRDPVMIDGSERSRDALEVEVTDEEKTDERHVYVVRTVTHARTVKGIDKSKTEENRTRVSWDVPRHRAEWTWSGAHGSKVDVHGTYRLEPRARGCALTLFASIDVKIPVVGRVVEGKIREGFETAWPAYVERVRNHAHDNA